MAELVEPRPADRCSFRKPFAPDFKDCPAFQAVVYGVTDFAGNRLAAVISCVHLEAGQVSRGGSSYPRCAVGGPAERARYVTATERWAG